jgi:hypothetical protein
MFRWRGLNRQPEPGSTDLAGKANIGDVGYEEQGCKGVQGREDKVSVVDLVYARLDFQIRHHAFHFGN